MENLYKLLKKRLLPGFKMYLARHINLQIAAILKDPDMFRDFYELDLEDEKAKFKVEMYFVPARIAISFAIQGLDYNKSDDEIWEGMIYKLRNEMYDKARQYGDLLDMLFDPLEDFLIIESGQVIERQERIGCMEPKDLAYLIKCAGELLANHFDSKR